MRHDKQPFLDSVNKGSKKRPAPGAHDKAFKGIKDLGGKRAEIKRTKKF